MRIAVTYENNQIFQHFGRCENFKIYDVEKNEIKIRVGDYEDFILKGTVILEKGWTKFEEPTQKDKILPKLEKGDKVKVTLRFRGREMSHMATSKHILDDFAERLSDIAVVEKAPKLEGRSMQMFLTEKR